MPGNPIHMDHNFHLKLVQNEEIKKKKKRKREEKEVRQKICAIQHGAHRRAIIHSDHIFC